MEVILYGGFLCSALRLVSLLLLWLSVLFKLLLLGWLHLDIRQLRKPYTK